VTANSRPVASRQHLPALDGLRFFAAACVKAAHGYWYLIPLQHSENVGRLGSIVMNLAPVGMTLFFVLSGFVIHFNYCESIQREGGIRRFFVARFSRLYPLFLLVFIVEVLRASVGSGYAVIPEAGIARPAAFFLTFTESWWFFPLGPINAAGAFGGVTGLMWSLSTEAFFYMCYPFIAPALRKLCGRKLLFYIVGISILAAALPFVAGHFRNGIDAWAIARFGRMPGVAFYDWLTFNSPWIRIFEFLIGVGAAQAYAVLKVRPQVGWLGVVAVISALGLYLDPPVAGLTTTALSPLFAFVIYSVTVRTRFSAVLSSRVMVAGGEASYSLYLLHYFIMHDLGVGAVTDAKPLSRIIMYFALMVASVHIARLSYLYFERPSMRWLRAVLDRRPAAQAPVPGAALLMERRPAPGADGI
jgi:peptidoglycan/LPS O-acetylase OafA/YrhL